MLLIDTLRGHVTNNEKYLGIFTAKVKGVLPWDADSIHSGITGSEEAVIYISQELADLGYRVIVFGDPPPHSAHRSAQANPRFVDVCDCDYPPLDIAISWRMASIGEDLKRIAKKVYLWPHDVCGERLTTKNINAFDGVLWLSQWQRNNWIAINPKLAKFKPIFGNGIHPAQFASVQHRENPFSCIYGSNYGRGLELLIELWPEVKALFSQATLDIYYGWESFGTLSQEREICLRQAIKSLSSLGVKEHGKVGHAALNQAYARSAFWTYPCLYPETFCITALRAQCAGAIPVVIESSALAETVRHGYACTHPNRYLHTLARAMESAETINVEKREKMKEFALKEYTWKRIAEKWDALFKKTQIV